MEHGLVQAALRAEVAAFTGAVAGFAEHDFRASTRCVPWTVAELLIHVRDAVNRLPSMLADLPPARADVSAAGYYQPDVRFSVATNADRVMIAQKGAREFATGRALGASFTAACEELLAAVASEPAGRLVRTRHGDAMSLTDFLATRVVELGLHGLDVSDALGRPAWLSPQAARVLELLLLSGEDPDRARPDGWDRLDFLRKATGRAGLSPIEAAELDRDGVRHLTLG
ncbi:maleylpyruvate isomerase N-terminal domain-containing protein [Allonocardiopsis opalescens]|uniref:Uncharacterized protein (TIGR03083 family) n=1 Tax=Allonocardiopsis opalescens TaxID=1144618 RepID=A0A2T0Q414_9ACTN|nr:maleylpyruvate isomerase N-terminal domain-containing protein [Allonocardiopsis opalescens]PRX98546.1 uncharacterized protein (TIGR03083 family) [Allonocardiopsis opalescens]